MQGLAFDDQDRLWASEFGQNTFDELNLIEPGDNYGWPLVEGRGGAAGLIDPQVVWDHRVASPSGLAFLDGHLWLALAARRAAVADRRRPGGGPRDPTDFFVGRLRPDAHRGGRARTGGCG